jgi:PASTA domain
MAHDSPARSPGDPGPAIPPDLDDDFDDLDLEDDDELDGFGRDGDGARERLFPDTPVARRTLLVSTSLAAVGLVALVVAVMYAVSHVGPSDQPLLITPLGLDGPAPAEGGETVSAPQPGGKVPDVVGMSFTRASALLERAGYRVEARYEQGSQPRDTVISQDPARGSQLGRRGIVTLVVSAGIVEDPAVLPTPTTIASNTSRRPPATTRKPPATTVKPAPPTTKAPTTTNAPPSTTASETTAAG